MTKGQTLSTSSWSKWTALGLQMILLFWQQPTENKCSTMPSQDLEGLTESFKFSCQILKEDAKSFKFTSKKSKSPPIRPSKNTRNESPHLPLDSVALISPIYAMRLPSWPSENKNNTSNLQIFKMLQIGSLLVSKRPSNLTKRKREKLPTMSVAMQLHHGS
jgi:hypothetical protein